MKTVPGAQSQAFGLPTRKPIVALQTHQQSSPGKANRSPRRSRCLGSRILRKLFSILGSFIVELFIEGQAASRVRGLQLPPMGERQALVV